MSLIILSKKLFLKINFELKNKIKILKISFKNYN